MTTDGLRKLTDDARRAWFWVTAVVATATAISGVLWYWWAYLWDVPPVIRVPVALGVANSVFVFLYLGLVVSHHYFGWPKEHPRLGGSSPSPVTGVAVVVPARVPAPPLGRPTITIVESGGEGAVLTVTNQGRPFKLLAKATLVESSYSAKKKHPYEVMRRDLKTGDELVVALAQSSYEPSRFTDAAWTMDSGDQSVEFWKQGRDRIWFRLSVAFSEVADVITLLETHVFKITYEKQALTIVRES